MVIAVPSTTSSSFNILGAGGDGALLEDGHGWTWLEDGHGRTRLEDGHGRTRLEDGHGLETDTAIKCKMHK